MKAFHNIILVVLIFLAVSSGITKVMLMEHDVEFFSKYGFTNSKLIAYGMAQVLGGVLLLLPKFRVYGAVIVAISFLISFIVLLLAGNVPMAIFTLVFIILLGFIIKKSREPKD